jgi:GAF domain-containing protein
MYDPAIVSAFVRIKDAFEDGRRLPSRAHVLGVIARAREGGAVERVQSLPSLTRDFIATAAEFGQMAGRAHDLETMCREVQARLAAILPDITLVIYQYDARRDRLFVRHASGPYEDAIQDLTIPLGARLSGWVAAHRSTIVNSEAALDLGHLTPTLSPTPQLCVSAPLAIGSYVVGAFTIYSPSSRPVGSNEAILIETLASLVAPIVRDSRRCRRSEADGLDESDPSLASDRLEAVQLRTARSHLNRVRAG